MGTSYEGEIGKYLARNGAKKESMVKARDILAAQASALFSECGRLDREGQQDASWAYYEAAKRLSSEILKLSRQIRANSPTW